MSAVELQLETIRLCGKAHIDNGMEATGYVLEEAGKTIERLTATLKLIANSSCDCITRDQARAALSQRAPGEQS